MHGDINPLAPHALPTFITAPGQSDSLLIGMGFFLAAAVFLVGILFFWLHSLPERMAHRSQKLQLELVAVLCLISLFTHNNTLWVVSLVLAVIDLPDLSAPLARIGAAIDRLTDAARSAGGAAATGAADKPEGAQPIPPSAPVEPADAISSRSEEKKPDGAPIKQADA